jgi:hypothetical protein
MNSNVCCKETFLILQRFLPNTDMRTLVLLATLCIFLAVASAQQKRPDISEVFSANLDIAIENRHLNITGKGLWVASQPHGKMLQKYEINEKGHEEEDIYRLERYDLGHTYEIFSWKGHNSSCHERTDHGPMPPIWGWLKEATASSKKIDGKDYDYWSFTRGYASIGVAVLSSAPDTPVFLFIHGAERNTTLRFTTWDTHPPREAHFAVPSICNHASSSLSARDVGCVSRSTIMNRAEVWVKNHVPYNQGGTYQGYREDCSGYVSMAWEASKPGLTTFTLPTISHPISKNQLQPGDVLLCRTEHVIIFGGWLSGGQFMGYEETRPGEGTVKRPTPYPYWYNTGCFQPYRLNSVC